MKKTFWVTLRNVNRETFIEVKEWMTTNTVEYDFNMGKFLTAYTFDHISYSFTNDDDAMLFKLSFSNYL
jgi:hypothetical protein